MINRSIGVSNFDLELLQDLMRTANVVPAVNQVRRTYRFLPAKSQHSSVDLDLVSPVQYLELNEVKAEICVVTHHRKARHFYSKQMHRCDRVP